LHKLQGKPADTGGYFYCDTSKTEAIMRPSAILNSIIG